MWFLLGNYHLISFACQCICWYMTYGHSAKIQEIQESLPLKPSVKEQQFLFCLGKRYEIGLKLREKYAWKVQGVVNSFWDLSPAMTLGPLGGRNINLFFFLRSKLPALLVWRWNSTVRCCFLKLPYPSHVMHHSWDLRSFCCKTTMRYPFFEDVTKRIWPEACLPTE